MFRWFRRRKEERERARRDEDPVLQAPPVRLHRAYWTFALEEKAALLARGLGALTWAETLRLHHLSCLEILESDAGRAEFSDESFPDPERMEAITGMPAAALSRDLVARLLSAESPYRPRRAAVWQAKNDQEERRPPDMLGVFGNASVTHLGSLEILRLNEHDEPGEVAFVPLSEIVTVVLGPRALFRPVRIFYVDGREEVAFAPMLYATSWSSPSEYLRSGQMTQFVCPVGANGWHSGMGVGQQDLTIQEGNGHASLFGIASVEAFTIADEEGGAAPDQGRPADA